LNKISLYSEGIYDVTIVPNTFIDLYMPSANGAYVKVYLYLLRHIGSSNTEITISSIADHLEDTEKDIIRALNYWEKQNLLKIERNAQDEITAIYLADLSGLNKTGHSTATIDDALEELDSVTVSEPDEIASNIHTETEPAAIPTFSQDKIDELKSNDKFQYVTHIVELYLGRPMKPVDLQLIIYLYDELKFSPELIIYLYEYCVSKNKMNPSYIEAVALEWAKEGIDTEEKAREATLLYNEHINNVMKAFGLNRTPGQIERKYITKWVEVYSFSDDIITEACNRTILRTQKPDFKYADKILETWFKKGAKTLEDIAILDEEFAKGGRAKTVPNVTPIAKPSANKFNQFPQRTYSAKDYAELERKLINKGL